MIGFNAFCIKTLATSFPLILRGQNKKSFRRQQGGTWATCRSRGMEKDLLVQRKRSPGERHTAHAACARVLFGLQSILVFNSNCVPFPRQCTHQAPASGELHSSVPLCFSQWVLLTTGFLYINTTDRHFGWILCWGWGGGGGGEGSCPVHCRCEAASLGSIHHMPLSPPHLRCDHQKHLQLLLNIPRRGKPVPHTGTHRESLLYRSRASETRARAVATLIIRKTTECGQTIMWRGAQKLSAISTSSHLRCLTSFHMSGG